MADSNFYSTLDGIPIDYLVATPLLAAARGNLALAGVLEEFIDTLTFGENKTSGTAITIPFEWTANYQKADGSWDEQKMNVKVPLISLVPMPALLVQRVRVKFSTKVQTSTVNSAAVKANATGSYGFVGFQVSATVTGTASTKSKSSQSATYSFDVEAEQQPETQGMQALMAAIAGTIIPQTDDGKKSK